MRMPFFFRTFAAESVNKLKNGSCKHYQQGKRAASVLV